MDSLKQDLDVLVSWRRLNDDFKRLNQNYQDYIGDFYIFRIALSPEFQGRRLGIEIIEYAYEYSRKQASRYTWIVIIRIRICVNFTRLQV